ncbi:MAG: adenine phosphoribosyltransferase [Vampirovibrionales bacterium]|nr:adenine phosphoribosyltransferase [Vampirovibrionales bacterium]
MTVVQTPDKPKSLSEIPFEAVRASIRDIADYPKPGILFKDITTAIAQPKTFKLILDYFELRYAEAFPNQPPPDFIVGIESRGFILGAPLADRMNAGFIPIRKKGKLPGAVERREYALEYGTDCVEVHRDAIPKGSRVLIIDDLLATGGTSTAAAELVTQVGGDLLGMLFFIELAFINGRSKLPPMPLADAMIVF